MGKSGVVCGIGFSKRRGRGCNTHSPVLLRTHCAVKLRRHWYRSERSRRGKHRLGNILGGYLFFFLAQLRIWMEDASLHNLLSLIFHHAHNLLLPFHFLLTDSFLSFVPFLCSHILIFYAATYGIHQSTDDRFWSLLFCLKIFCVFNKNCHSYALL